MPVSRRALLRRMGGGAVAAAAIPMFRELAFAAAAPPSRKPRPASPVRLNMNENAYGPSDKVKAALRESLSLANRFPDSTDALVARIAALHAVKPDQVVVGCGSREVLRMAAATLLGRGRKLILASPTFDPIADYARDTG